MIKDIFFRRSKADEEMRRQEALASRNNRSFIQQITQSGDEYARYKGKERAKFYKQANRQEYRRLQDLRRKEKKAYEALERYEKGKDLDKRHLRALAEFKIEPEDLKIKRSERPDKKFKKLRRETNSSYLIQKSRTKRTMRRDRDREWGQRSKQLQDESKGLAA